MDQILLAQGAWQERVAEALLQCPRPIPVDPRFMARSARGDLALPRHDRSVLPPARQASTLLLLYPGQDGELRLPLTVRNATMRAHAGEVSLPGGASDEADASREATALRETLEEIGVVPDDITLLGMLDDVWIPITNFEIRPFVGAMSARPEMAPQTDEVAQIVELPLRKLLVDGAVTDELVHGPGWTLRVGGYLAEGQLVWGATGQMLAMFASVMHGLSPLDGGGSQPG